MVQRIRATKGLLLAALPCHSTPGLRGLQQQLEMDGGQDKKDARSCFGTQNYLRDTALASSFLNEDAVLFPSDTPGQFTQPSFPEQMKGQDTSPCAFSLIINF